MAASGRDLQMRELMDTMKELKLTIETLRKELTAKDKLRLLPALNIPMEHLATAIAVIKAACK